MLQVLLLRNFNNYSNRLYRRYEFANSGDSFANYKKAVDNDISLYHQFEIANFSFNDGLSAEITLNLSDSTYWRPLDGWDYCVIHDSDNHIASPSWRYFIVDSTFNRKDQQTLTLKRDVLADFPIWTTSPAVIHKASAIPTSFSYAKYRKDMDLSQVKTSETLIKDRTDGRGWIVGYLTKDFIGTTEGDTSIEYQEKPTEYDDVIDDISAYSGKTFAEINTNIFDLGCYMKNSTWPYMIAEIAGYSEAFWSPFKVNRYDSPFEDGQAWYSTILSKYGLQFNHTEFESVEGTIESALRKLREATLNAYVWSAYSQYGTLKELRDGEIVYDKATKKAYRVSEEGGWTDIQDGFTQEMLDQYINNVSFAGKTGNAKFYASVNYFSIHVDYSRYTFTEITDTATVKLLVRQDHQTTSDSAYDIFAIPLGGTVSYINESDPSTSVSVKIDDSYVMDIVNTMISKYKVATDSSAGLIDIQWLPYGPDQIIGNFTENANLIRVGTSTVGILLWLKSCQLEKTITGANYTLTIPSDPLQARIYGETHSWRLCSPNQASMFDFSAVKNEGITGYNVDIAFKPFTPYICVAPIFNGLYGSNFDDGRGLILSGDFSLDQVSNLWNQYKWQNKNYELIFNRQIATMDVEMTYAQRTANQQKVTDAMATVTGTLKGIGGGALAGKKSGIPYGAAIGAVVGGSTALASGIINQVYDRENAGTESFIRSLNRQNTIDQYQYQIANIKARGDTITKISAFNPNNKIYPTLEAYECTYQEKTQLAESIKWSGLSLEMIGTPSQFSSVAGCFISATPLRMEHQYLSNQFYSAITQELEVGVYLYGSNDLEEEEEES